MTSVFAGGTGSATSTTNNKKFGGQDKPNEQNTVRISD